MSATSYSGSGCAPSPSKPPIIEEAYQLKSGQYGYDHVPSQYTDEHLDALQKYDLKLKRRIRVLRIVSRTSTAIFSIAVMVMMAMTLEKFMTTRDTYINGRTAWAKNTKLWPTIMLFSVALTTLVINLVILIAYLRSVKAANRVSVLSTAFGLLVFGGHVVVWVATAVLYRYGKDTNGVSNDLWGWACSKGADKIQENFKTVVNFQAVCNRSVGSPPIHHTFVLFAGPEWQSLMRVVPDKRVVYNHC
ncbi:MAG: hypothetical protein M1840_002065 [Geoglossum simile]|nr:MAG: hypothetical protein M1840_002065 [Geoglossum simile]